MSILKELKFLVLEKRPDLYPILNAGNFMLMNKAISNKQALDLVESEDFEISNLKKVKVNGVVVLGEIL